MSLGFSKNRNSSSVVVVYHGDVCLGELDIVQIKDRHDDFRFPNNEVRIHHLSLPSERCPPLSVLQTVSSSFSVRCKLEPNVLVEQSPLKDLHASCFHERKTAVVLIGDEEVHLVAMPSKQKKFPCFWCCSVRLPSRLYNACMGMLNMRCLAIVFDLDETLIVANTMKSFEIRIEALTSWIDQELDPVRLSGMTAELKRIVEDRELLKKYSESDSVVDNGKTYNVQMEKVPLNPAGQEQVLRPVIRLPEKNLVLTRINPEIRDTSVLVRLRPAWEDLRSYLIAKGRKRFEVYVCTMAERDYALEMWRLLDPETHLIGPKQLLDRVVCVKSGQRKSLTNVFQDGNCHPRMAMVIDDRLKVWEDKDQPRVHVVPAFSPYFAPQAETASAVPVLCVARNVACNVRGGFFKEFDEILLRKICFELFYEDEAVNLPSAPDVSSYLMPEDACFVSNGNGSAPLAEGMHGTEVSQRLNQEEVKNVSDSAKNLDSTGKEQKSETSQPPVTAYPNASGSASFKPSASSEKPSLLGAPFRRDATMIHFPDSRCRSSGDPPLISRLPVPQPLTLPPPQGGWLVEENANRGILNNRAPATVHGSEALRPDRHRSLQSPLSRGISSHASSGSQTPVSEVKIEEPYQGSGILKKSAASSQISDGGVYQNQSSFNSRELPVDGGKLNLSIGVLQEIGQRCCSKVEFRSIMSTDDDFQFSVEVLFTGEKIGFGRGKTRKDAQQQAADNALRSLAEKYMSYITSQTGAVGKDLDKLSLGIENGFILETSSPGANESLAKDGLSKESTSE